MELKHVATDIILDCDPGHDDAIAIMLAGFDPAINLLGVTVSTGNQTQEKTARNALNVVHYLGIDAEVHKGAPAPLVRPLQIADDIHGESGLDGFEFPVHDKTVASVHAVDYIIETLQTHHKKITVVTTGPMTNLALALRKAPEIASNIEEVVFMGGAYGYGNVSPAAEFNMLVDPEAAHIVLSQPFPITMVGLDVTRQALALPEIVERMDALGTPAATMFASLMRAFNANQKKVFAFEGGPLHDPITIAYLIDRSVLTTKHVNCTIDLSQGESYGRTNCDMFDYLGNPRNVNVATGIDTEKFWDIVARTIKRY